MKSSKGMHIANNVEEGSMPHVPTSPGTLAFPDDFHGASLGQPEQPVAPCFPLTAIKNCLNAITPYSVPTMATLIMLYLATVYGFFGMLRGGALTDNSVLRPVAQTWFFMSSFNFNLSPNIEFLQNFLLLFSALWQGTKGTVHRLLVIPAFLWSIAATMPGTAASIDSLDSVVPNNKMFAGAGTAVFSAIFFVTRFTAIVNFLYDLYFTTVLNVKLMHPQYAQYRELRNDLYIARERINRTQTFGNSAQFTRQFYLELKNNNHLQSRTMRECLLYVAEDIVMGKLLPAVGAVGVFPTFQYMADQGVKASEHVSFLHPVLSRIDGSAFNKCAASASSMFYYRTGAKSYNMVKNLLLELKEILTEGSGKAKTAYSMLLTLLFAQAYTSGGGLAEERLSANYPRWLAWFNSWLVMGETGFLVNGKAFGDFFLKIRAKMQAPDVTASKALVNYFFGLYHDRMPEVPHEITIEKMISILEEAIVLHGLHEDGNLKLKSDGSDVLLENDIKDGRRRWMQFFSQAPSVVVSQPPSAAPADESAPLLGRLN